MRRSLFVIAAVFLFGAAASSANADCPRTSARATDLAREGDALAKLNVDGAIAKYEEARSLAPTDHRILEALGLLYVKKESWDDAAKNFANAAKLAPGNARYLLREGQALAQRALTNDIPWTTVRVPLDAAIKLDPSYAEAHLALGDVLDHLHETNGARAEYTTAVTLRPNAIDGWVALADSYFRVDSKLAGDVVTEALRWGDAKDLRILAGDVAMRQGKALDAAAHYQAARALCGDCGNAILPIDFRLGVALASAKPLPKAEAVAQLELFNKRACRGGLASRYASECEQTQSLLLTLGQTP